MLTIFSHALLLVDCTREEILRAKAKMKNAGIAYEIRVRRNQKKDAQGKASELYAMYVRKCDYTEAKKVMERG
ncbi:MAG: hypothetical protein Q4C04_01960 [Clostridia bacterium]|nr:hypothetical protein [Clostridia bacterium]